jgi:hypothetical protein
MYYNRKIALTTLGCKLNFSETSAIGRALTDNGYQRVDFPPCGWHPRQSTYRPVSGRQGRQPQDEKGGFVNNYITFKRILLFIFNICILLIIK